MREFLAAILTVIAMGVLLIAYSLSGSRVAAAPGLVQYDPRLDGSQLVRPAAGAERVAFTGDPYSPYVVRPAVAYPVSAGQAAAAYNPYTPSAPAVRRVTTSPRRT